MRFARIASRWVVLLFVAAALLVFALNLGSAGPMIQADEGSYLANAAAIAGHNNDLASSYHAGYSILLSPAFLPGWAPDQVWVLVKLINAALYGISLLLLWRIARHLYPKLPPSTSLFGVALVGLYPMWVVMVGYAFAQIAFVPAYLLVAYLYLRATDSHHWGRVVLLGMAAGGLYWIHPVAAPVIAALLLAALSWTVAIRRPMFFVQVVSGVAIALLLHKWAFQPWLYERMTIGDVPPRLHYQDLGDVFSGLFTLEGFQRLVSVAGGHTFYLVVGTGGLVVFALGVLVRWLVAPKIATCENSARRSFALLLLGSFMGVLCLSIIVMSNPVRLDHWIYGRYVEGVLAPLLLVAVLSPWYVRTDWIILVAMGAATLLWSGFENYGHVAPFNVSTFWQTFLLSDYEPLVWIGAGLGLLTIFLVLPRPAALGAIAIYFVVNIGLQLDYHAVHSVGARQRSSAGEVVRRTFPAGSCIGFDHAGTRDSSKADYLHDFGFYLYDYALTRTDAAGWREDCDGPFFSFEKDVHQSMPDVAPLVFTPRGGPILYARTKDIPEQHVRIYPVRFSNSSTDAGGLLGGGWHDLEANLVWSTAAATLYLPVPRHCQRQSCQFQLKFVAFGASPDRPVGVRVGHATNLEPGYSASVRLVSEVDVNVEVRASDFPMQVLRIEVPSAVSPKDLLGSRDPRVLGIGLRSVDLLDKKGTN